MKRKARPEIPPAANDNGGALKTVGEERHLDAIAQAIGRHIAREETSGWDRKGRTPAANDNGSRGEGAGS